MPDSQRGAAPDGATMTLQGEVGEAVGHPVDRHGVEAAERPGFLQRLADQRLLIGTTFGTVVVLGAIASLATGSWWLLPAAVLVHALATVAVVGTVFHMTTEVEKPDPVTAARLADEGVPDPEQAVNDAVDASPARG